MKTSTRILTPFLSLTFIAVLSCSKTQDTAPERRIFGNPPVIQSVEPVFLEPAFAAACDFTDIMVGLFCSVAGFSDVEAQAGNGWTVAFDPDGTNRRIVFSDVPSATAGVFINGTYMRLTFKVKATDPESTAQQNNILLVSSSFVQSGGSSGSQNENTLVLFDDGSENEFEIAQEADVFEDCHDVRTATCSCSEARYKAKSGDLDKGDDQFMRTLALINRNTPPFFQDCILLSQNVVGVLGEAGSRFDFKIEAFDRQGNPTAWPDTLSAVVEKGTFECAGDSCGCCMLHTFSQLADVGECIGQPGMLSPSYKRDGVPIGIPTGFCDECITRPLTNPC